jgi:hypothetical protein
MRELNEPTANASPDGHHAIDMILESALALWYSTLP